MSYKGDILIGQTIDWKFTTVSTTGVPTTLTSATISAYVGNTTTEFTTGLTLSTNFDSIVGLNHVRVVASTPNGFLSGTDVSIIVAAGTVGGNSVIGYVAGDFSIENRVVKSVVGNVTGDVQGNVDGSVAEVLSVGMAAIDNNSFAAGAIDAAALAASAGQEIADEILNRDIAGGGSGDTRNVRNALRRLRNRVAIAAGVGTVYQENDITVAWTASITTAAGNPVVEIDPS